MIAVVEIINKTGYKKQEDCNIVVVPDENDIILRYLFLYGQSNAPPTADLNTLKMGFEEHYKNYISKLNKKKASDRKERID